MGNLAADLAVIIRYILKDPALLDGSRVQFRRRDGGKSATARDINAAFLEALTGEPFSSPARSYLLAVTDSKTWGSTAAFYLKALRRIEEELSGPGLDDLNAAADALARDLDLSSQVPAPHPLERFWNFFFPEGTGIVERRGDSVRDLRRRRTVTVMKLNPDPVSQVHEQILFTSNVLLTTPQDGLEAAQSLDPSLTEALGLAAGEEQAFWYDHPVPVGIETERNEAVYGLRAMDNAVRFEIERGRAPPDARIPVLISISTTHHGLQALARDYLGAELDRAGGTDRLRVYAAAERDVGELLSEVLLPAADHYFPDRDIEPLKEILGVDGEYGRHYSFLKASAALWHVLVDDKVKATFKFDLDQVFPQDLLVSETGKSAFEHLSDPLWGAHGTDSQGMDVELGMLAGALVNEEDIDLGLFTPDVKWPAGKLAPDHWVFASAWPQALSTEAEMMTRYGENGPGGRGACLQRVHVTGGTTGITVQCLRRYRPFTPSWIGRAEDQAYLLSVLFPKSGPALRYVHASGLFMRHDKEAFTADAVKAARIGKMVGDYVRILNFTSYAKALPWGAARIKEAVDPFTGCFISRIPVTVSCLRLAITAANFFSDGSASARKDGEELIRIGTTRMADAMRDFCDEKKVKKRLKRERAGWDLYYDLLDALEKDLKTGDRAAMSWRDRARELIEGWRISTGESRGTWEGR